MQSAGIMIFVSVVLRLRLGLLLLLLLLLDLRLIKLNRMRWYGGAPSGSHF
jgi:hypothetical protein